MEESGETPMTTELSRLEDVGMTLQLAIDPEKAIENAEKCCKALMKIVEGKELYINIGKARHLKNEAWLIVSHFFGTTPRLERCSPYTDELSGASGFEAVVEAYHIPTRQVIGRATAICLNNEENWGMRPKYEGKGEKRRQTGVVATPSYQLDSMAQTRASSKVLSQLFRWVVVLGGFSGTPAEEAEEGSEKETTGHPKNGGNGSEKIEDSQRRQIFGAANSHRYPKNDLPALFKKHGFERADQITKDKFPAIIAEIEGHKAT
jgi:hypothetical protein